MTSQVVSLEVIAEIPIDCDFRAEDDCWKGLCRSLSITGRGGSFEDAKRKMADELQGRIVGIVLEHLKRSTQRVA